MTLPQTVNHIIPTEVNTSGNADGKAVVKQIKCTLWGDLNKPLVVLLGGISSSRWALSCQEREQTGWWDQVVNQQSWFSPNDFSFLTFDYFTYHERVTNPPVVKTKEQANILHQIQTKLNLNPFYAVVGSSYGGMVALAFAAEYPSALEHLICIAAADHNSVKSQALRYIQRQIIELGERYLNRQQASEIKEFTALARSLAMIGYRGEVEFEQRFQNEQIGQSLFDVSSYLKHHGDRFAKRFSVARYAQLSQSIDYHQIDVSNITAKTQLIGFSSDQMVPVKTIQNLQLKLQQQTTAESHISIIDSLYGHDGFLLESKKLNQIFQTFFSEYEHDNFKRNCRG